MKRTSTWLLLFLVTACAPATAPEVDAARAGKGVPQTLAALQSKLDETNAIVAQLEQRLAATEAVLNAVQLAGDTSAQRLDKAEYQLNVIETYYSSLSADLDKLEGRVDALSALGYVDVLAAELAALEATACTLSDVALTQIDGGKPTPAQQESLKAAYGACPP
jgi:septal ring factor EnvC (AmiA/AmiB activator)